ncbi:hypothetical protein LWI29_013818 [Acer saccharum]|uniref:Uncharacterized protein n=1 Tax=Acer saccharum TaxID=4024 RepID=A0AA39VMH0_ACESA|nr:hypothetical protein LWI29_013818 [Acer saccharum]
MGLLSALGVVRSTTCSPFGTKTGRSNAAESSSTPSTKALSSSFAAQIAAFSASNACNFSTFAVQWDCLVLLELFDRQHVRRLELRLDAPTPLSQVLLREPRLSVLHSPLRSLHSLLRAPTISQRSLSSEQSMQQSALRQLGQIHFQTY